MNELALFAGAGGGILGGKLLGWRTVCAVERDAYAAQVLAQRQNDGMLEPFPIWSDVCSFDGRPWRGIVDVVSGGFPCQDISAAGKGAGIDGERSGLWAQFARIIGEVRPRFVFVENSPMLTSRGLGRVLGDLASLGFDAEWGVLGADDAGAPHIRERIWIAAHSLREGLSEPKQQALFRERGREEGGTTCELRGALSDPPCNRYRKGGEIRNIRQADGGQDRELLSEFAESGWWATEPALDRVAHGVAHRVDRLKAIGNGQVPQVARLAWETLMRRVNEAT